MAFTSWNIGQYVYCNCLLTRLCDVINFELNLIFLTKPTFLHDQKVKTKMSISWEQKELLIWNKKHFSWLLKGFRWSKWNNFFGRWEPYFKHDESYLLTVPKLEHQSCFWHLVTALYHKCVKLMSRWLGLALKFDAGNVDFCRNTPNKNKPFENSFKNAENQEFKLFVWLYFRNLSKTQSVKSSSI